MARPQFTAPVERPNDTSARQGSAVGRKGAASPGAGGNALAINETINGAEVLEAATWRVMAQDRAGDVHIQARAKDSGAAILYDANANAVAQSSFNLDPGIRVPDGGSIEIRVYNEGSSSVTVEVSTVSRPQ